MEDNNNNNTKPTQEEFKKSNANNESTVNTTNAESTELEKNELEIKKEVEKNFEEQSQVETNTKRKKEPAKIRFTTAFLLFLIIILACSAVCFYFYHKSEVDKLTKLQKEKTAATNTVIEPISTPTPTEEAKPSQTPVVTATPTAKQTATPAQKKDLDISSATVKELYTYIPSVPNTYNSFSSSYRNRKITINDLDPKYILLYAYNIAYDNKEIDENQVAEGGWPIFNASILQNHISKMYNTKIENQDFYSSGVSTFTYNTNGTYKHSYGGWDTAMIKHDIRTILSAYEENNELYIIDEYICMFEYTEQVSATSKTPAKVTNYGTLYKDSLGEYSIDANINLDDYSKNGQKGYDEIFSAIKSKYSDKMTKYIHTFKKNDKGDYYWYSTEPYKNN